MEIAASAVELAPIVAPLIIDAIKSLSSSSTPQTMPRLTTPGTFVGPDPTPNNGMDIDNILANPALPIRPTFFDIPRNLGPSLVLPFQLTVSEWKGTELLVDFDLAANASIRTLLAPYRYAHLETLEIAILPAQASATYPGTVEVRYLTADTTPVATDMIEHPGAVRVTIGGPVGAISNSCVPAPLQSFSPVLKSPFLPCDRIKVAVNHWLNTDATVAKNIHVLIATIARGTIRVGYPSNS